MAKAGRLVYPPAPVSDATDDYHGTAVPDPYRLLEDLKSTRTRQWVDAQNRLTRSQLSTVAERGPLRKRLAELWPGARWEPPSRHGDLYFLNRRERVDGPAVLYTLARLDGTPRAILDPAQLSPDGRATVTGLAISPRGLHVAYRLDNSAAWRVRDVATAKDTSDVLTGVRGIPSWGFLGKGLYYVRSAGENGAERIFYQALGTAPEDATQVRSWPELAGARLTLLRSFDGRFLIVFAAFPDGTREIYASPINPEDPAAAGDFRPLSRRSASRYQFIDQEGSWFFFLTDDRAPRGRVVKLSFPPAEPVDVIPASEAVLEDARRTGRRLIVQGLRDASAELFVYGLDGRREREIRLPAFGTVSGLSASRGSEEVFFGYTSFAHPQMVFRCELGEPGSKAPIGPEPFRAPKLPFDPNAFETARAFVTSRDGTRFPVFLFRKGGTSQEAPAMLQGYGGFRVNASPDYSARLLAFAERGGVVARAAIRGGAEYGEAWHQAAVRELRNNAYDDFTAAAEWLVKERITTSPRLAIAGGSNGGLLVGAVLTRRPDLFGAAVPSAGVFDMLRFPRFTVGRAWIPEYGSPDEPEDFRWLFAYSPLHNVRKGTVFPAVLVTAAEDDERVVPSHSYKFVAALQAAQAGEAPILLRVSRISPGSGRRDRGMLPGRDETSEDAIDEAADVLAFLTGTLGPSPEEPKHPEPKTTRRTR